MNVGLSTGAEFFFQSRFTPYRGPISVKILQPPTGISIETLLNLVRERKDDLNLIGFQPNVIGTNIIFHVPDNAKHRKIYNDISKQVLERCLTQCSA